MKILTNPQAQNLAGTIMLEFEHVQLETEQRIRAEMFNRYLYMWTRGSHYM